MKRRSGAERPMRGRLVSRLACRCCVSVGVEPERASERRGARREIAAQIEDATSEPDASDGLRQEDDHG